MIGLLYKDFVSVNRLNKIRLTWIIAACTIVYGILRAIFPGTLEIKEFMVENDSGKLINLIDTIFIMPLAIILICGVSLINGWVSKIIERDEKNKIQAYLYAMPLKKNAYVLSKYVFIATAAICFLAISYLWGLWCRAFCGEGYMLELTKLVIKFIPAFASLAILSAAIELPLFIHLGKSRAMLIKIAFIMLIAFVVIGFVMFGDLNWLSENLNAIKLLMWYQEHEKGVKIFCAWSPVVSLILFYVSYRVSVIVK